MEDEPGIAGLDGEEYDEKYDEAVAIVCESGQASISGVQRRLRIGYNRAGRSWPAATIDDLARDFFLA